METDLKSVSIFGVRGMHTIQEVKVLGSAVQGKIEA